MIKVAVLYGGISSEHDISILSGKNVLDCLNRKECKPIEIFIDEGGVWHRENIVMSHKQALLGIDVAFNVLHGQYGEDGRVQALLDSLGIPYTGADAQASTVSLNKFLTKEVLAKHGILMPAHKLIKTLTELANEPEKLFRSFGGPVIVKPAGAGSSVGITLASTSDQLSEGIKTAFAHSPEVLMEEYISGREATIGVVDGLLGEQYYALPPIEIVPPPNSKFFDREVKYSGETIERVPGNFTQQETTELQRMAKLAHEVLGLRHYSRSDFIVSPAGIYFLESNSAAAVGLTRESLLPKALNSVGISTEQFLDHIIKLVLNN